MNGIFATQMRDARCGQRATFRSGMGSALRSFRKQNGLRMSHVSRATGISQQMLSRMETTGKGITLENIMTVGEAIGCTDFLMAHAIRLWRGDAQ
ncbi:helix-turn-helix protein [Acetobacter aceti NBRC 14818]|nr:helix-turn-helix transcriptional regulator [Acetobacter aceti]TCS31776.1 helix-turn-helix protein [Acetobacter aceti NBRC 14818]